MILVWITIRRALAHRNAILLNLYEVDYLHVYVYKIYKYKRERVERGQKRKATSMALLDFICHYIFSGHTASENVQRFYLYTIHNVFVIFLPRSPIRPAEVWYREGDVIYLL